MSEIQTNIFYNANFNMVFRDSPELNFFAQDVTFPGINLSEIPTPWMNNAGYMADNRIEYDPLTVDFILDEEMITYFYILEWLYKISTKGGAKDYMQDATIIMTTNNKQVNHKIVLTDCFPTNLAPLSLSTNSADPTPVLFSATFRYQLFYFDKPNEVDEDYRVKPRLS